MLTVLSQLEIERSSERTIMGIDGALKAKHTQICPYGYKKQNKRLIINDETAPIIRRIFEEYLDGKSAYRIAKDFSDANVGLRHWNSTFIDKILSNRIYIGEYEARKYSKTQKAVIIKGFAPPIIDKEIWIQSEKQREKNSHSHYIKYDYMFRQKLVCKHCGSLLNNVSATGRNGNTQLYYKCSNKKCSKQKNINEKKIEKEVLYVLDDIFNFYCLLDNTFITTNIVNYNNKIVDLKNQIESINTKEEHAKNILLEGIIKSEELRNILDKLSVDKQILEDELENIRYLSNNLLTVENACNNFNYNTDYFLRISHYVGYNKLWQKLSNKQKQSIISKFIDNIIIKSTVGKEVSVDCINLKESRIIDVSYKLRYDVFITVYNEEKQKSILDTYEYQDTHLKQFYKINSVHIGGKLINAFDIDDELFYDLSDYNISYM